MLRTPTQNKPYPPYVSLVMRGRELDPERITEQLGVRAHRSFKRGDKRQQGNSEWPHGFWTLESSEEIKSIDLEQHVSWLLQKIEPLRAQLTELLKDKTIEAKISCFWIMPSSNETFVLEPEILAKIASLKIKFELDIYGPD